MPFWGRLSQPAFTFPPSFWTDPLVLFVFGVIATIVITWLVWTAEHRPKSDNTCRDVYVDDSTIRKVEVFDCRLCWGTRLFPFRKLKIYDAPVSASVLIRYTPKGGLEKDLPCSCFEDIPIRNRVVKPVKLKGKHYFQSEEVISEVKLFVLTPFEREKYSINVKHELKDKVLRIWNQNTEEIRNYRMLLTRPIRLQGINIVKGNLVSVDMEVAYPALNQVISKKIGTISTDVTMSLILNLPPNDHKAEGQIIIRLGD